MAVVGLTWPGGAVPEDRDARFEEIVRTHGTRVRSLVHRMVGTDAEDLVQEIFLQVYRALPGFRGEAKVATWLYRIAANQCLDHLRHRRRSETKVVHLAEPSLEEVAEAAEARLQASPEELAEARDLAREVRRSLESLPDDLRVVVVLRDFEGLAYRELAAVLGLPLGTVQSRLHRARELLKRRLAPYLEG